MTRNALRRSKAGLANTLSKAAATRTRRKSGMKPRAMINAFCLRRHLATAYGTLTHADKPLWKFSEVQ
jgi:hypothetical protein